MASQDVIKTRVQTWDLVPGSHTTSLTGCTNAITDRPSTLQITRDAYRHEGARVFFRGLGICSARAFFVNAVQWAVSRQTLHLSSPITDTNAGLRMDDECVSRLALLPKFFYLRANMHL